MCRYCESSYPEKPINSERVVVPGDRQREPTKSVVSDAKDWEVGFGPRIDPLPRKPLERQSHVAGGEGVPGRGAQDPQVDPRLSRPGFGRWGSQE